MANLTLSPEALAFIVPIVTVCRKQFPKHCKNCKKDYLSFEAFIQSTQPIGVPGAFSEEDDPIGVLSYVNCSCGSTLLLKCEDMSGQQHQMFNQMLASESSRLGKTPKEVLLALRTVIRKLAQDGKLPK